MNTNLVIIPTRGRPKNAQRSFDAIKKHSLISDIIFGLDDDDQLNYPRIDGAKYEVFPRFRMNKTLNLIARINCEKYQTITFMGDDHLVETDGWDEKLYSSIKSRGYGFSYGNDSAWGEGLPTAIMMSTNIIRSLGFMAPHELIHLQMDSFWLDFGKAINAIDYYPDVSIRHIHYGNTPGIFDKTYAEANSDSNVEKDFLTYKKYQKEEFQKDVNKFLETIK